MIGLHSFPNTEHTQQYDTNNNNIINNNIINNNISNSNSNKHYAAQHKTIIPTPDPTTAQLAGGKR